MSKILRSLFVICVMVTSTPIWADKIADAINVFRNAEETQPFFENSYGFVVFPTIAKGGIGIGGAHGKGQVFQQGEPIGQSKMTQLTVGFQLGAQAFSQIIFFEDERALREFISGGFEFGAQATAVALTAGVSAQASTGGGATANVSGGQNDSKAVHGGYSKGMAVLTIAKGGLMYEATIGGQKFKFKAK